MLAIKFKALEDMKDGLRDMLVFQKYFYPLKVQSMITENMRNFKTAADDQTFSAYQKKAYDELFAQIENLPEVADQCEDVELVA